MDKVRYSSLKFKIWEDKEYKLEKQRQNTHLDEIKLELVKKNVGRSLENSLVDSDNER